jgi:hypothetical protein
MTPTLAFTFSLAPPREGEDPIDWNQVLAEHDASLSAARALRILRCPRGWSGSLDSLVQAGQATISCEDPFVGLPDADPARDRLLCDAVIPSFDASRLWLQVYLLEAGQDDSTTDAPLGCKRLDAVPLQQLGNETCWFYPTEDGNYLASERTISVRFAPGVMAEAVPMPQSWSYDRGDLSLLWSLMADEEDLSCVGLTYQRRRIEFPRQSEHSASTATWSSFRVDSMASPSFQRLSTISTYG